ncbi:serine/threonine protein kinase, partial [Bifidobacteriaceae bacterium NR021]
EVPSIDLGTVTFKQAKKILEAKGLRVVSDSMAKDDDIVMSMSEEAGSKVEKGKAITLITRPSLGSSSDSY